MQGIVPRQRVLLRTLLLDRLGLRGQGNVRGRLISMPANVYRALADRGELKRGFRRRIAYGFFGLTALYAVYAVGAFLALDLFR